MFRIINILTSLYIISDKELELKIRSFLPFYFILIYILTIICSLSAYFEHNAWLIGDWLINYAGGFLRRGFLGEILYYFYLQTGINLAIFVVLIHNLFYGIFLYFSYKILKEIPKPNILAYSLLIFSPFIFMFHIYDYDPGAGCRKEIIFLAIMALTTYLGNLISTKLEVKDGKLMGKFLTKNCYGTEKVNRLLEKYDLNRYGYIYAYGDSKGDREILRIANKKFYKYFK